jgi:xylulokinase
MDAERDVWQVALGVIRRLLAAGGVSASAVQVIGVCGLVPCLCALDADGQPAAPVIVYSDNRALEELDWVNREAGLALTAEAPLPKLVWLRSHAPEQYACIRTVFSAHNYVVYRLTGERCVDYDTASILGGIFDAQAKCWSTEVCRRVGVPLEFFPRPIPATAVAGALSQEAAGLTGLPAGTPVIAGSGDTFPTMVGCGVVDPGDAMVSYGTTGLLTLTQRPLVDSAAGPHFDDGSGRASVAWVANVLSAGRLVYWYADQFGRAGLPEGCSGDLYQQLDAAAAALPPGAEGLIALPHWLGRRTPSPDALLRGALIGLTPHHTPVHIYRALLEAFAYNLCQSYPAVRPQVHRLVATAGGARSRLWRQIVTDVLNTPMEYFPSARGSLGIAFLAGYAAGLIADFGAIKHSWLIHPEVTTPDADAVSLYRDYWQVYTEFEQRMAAPFAQLARIQPSQSGGSQEASRSACAH